MEEQSSFDGTSGKVFLRRWNHPQPRYRAVLVHGYGEHSGRYRHVADALWRNGATVTAHDHFGHGQSDGERALITDTADLVTDLATVMAQREDLPTVLIGHSMGSIVAARYAQQSPGDVAALVLSGQIIGGNPGFEALLGMDPLPEIPIDPGALSRDPAVGMAYAADKLVWHGPFKRPTLAGLITLAQRVLGGPGFGSLPVLWLHGELDPLAPLAQAQEAIQRLRGARTEQQIYPGAMHEVFNETNRAQVLAHLTDFVDRTLLLNLD